MGLADLSKIISTIGDLETGEYHPVYCRGDDSTVFWAKIDPNHHVRVREEHGMWIREIHDGEVVEIEDPTEDVVVLYTATDKVA